MPNSLPFLSNLSLTLTIDEEAANLGPQLIDSDVTFFDADDNFDGGTLVLSGLLADDTGSIRNQGTGAGEIGFSGGNITFGGTLIGTASGGEGTALSITFNAQATSAGIEALIENLTFATLSDTPAFTRTLELAVTDAAGARAVTPVRLSEQTGDANPFNGIDIGSYSSAAFTDIDGDGDLDMVIGENTGNLNYYENTGTRLAPVYTERTGAASPFDGIDIGSSSNATFADLDRDGVMDLVVGDFDGTISFFSNSGTAVSPFFFELPGVSNPFNGIDIGEASAPRFADVDGDGVVEMIVGESDGTLNYFDGFGGPPTPLDGIDVGIYSNPALVDFDGDGDLDLAVGADDGTLSYFENIGTLIAPDFVARTGAANPFNGIDVGSGNVPSFADLDGDGDADLIIGELDGVLNYYRNDGLPSAAGDASFIERTGTMSPFGSIDVGSYSKTVLADVDGDGDLDLLIGDQLGTLNYFENTGTRQAPVYAERTGAENPFAGFDVGIESAPALADLDGDGDLDLLVGESDGTINYYENTGAAGTPAYTVRSGAANPFDGIDVGSYSTPTLADLDGDGDLDLAVGDADGMISYFENTGSVEAPVYITRSGTANPFDGIDVGFYSTLGFADLDGDGDLDLTAGEFNGTLVYYENTGTGLAPAFTPRTGTSNPFDGVIVSSYSAPIFADVDGDGDLDGVIGEGAGVITYFENVAAPRVPEFTGRTGAANPFDGIDVGFYSSAAFADIDFDGNLDLVIGENDGNLNYYENTGTRIAPAYTARTGTADPFNGIDVGLASAMTFADIDRDGVLDLVVGTQSGTLEYFQYTSTGGAPAYTERTGGANPFDGIYVGSHSTPELADIDGDGDLDLVVGKDDGSFDYFENTGTAVAPAYTERTGTANPFGGIDVGSYSTPELADIDGDGDLDLVVGEDDGSLYYFENTGTSMAPAYTARTGADNPFDGIDAGSYSTPELADIDGDGDLDLVVGDRLGTFTYYENTGPSGFQFVLNVTQHADPSAQADVINGTSENNYLYGLGGDDTLRGLGGNDMLFGGLGADAMDGGTGFDYARYDDATSGVIVYLANDRPNSGEAAGDTFANIEGLILSSHNDYGFGDDGANYIYGQGGSDSLAGGLGADVLDGGEGFDYVRYDDAAYPDDIRVYLQSQYSNLNTGVAAIGDTFVSIEGLQTSVRNDTLFGNSENNILLGNLGTDNLYGFTGNDTLYGGAGDPNGDGVRDNFVFDQAPIAANADIVGDFERGLDQIALSSDIFGTNEARIQFNAGTRELVYTGVNGNEYNVIATLIGETVFDASDYYFY
ncbi:FG-GAP-like repeat-containing protein [Hoeflea sp.]|uniref:calcium-binding protein n=1 Tax=Hoeflea sp. TaxID=1940281 RepID=UPI003BB18FDA